MGSWSRRRIRSRCTPNPKGRGHSSPDKPFTACHRRGMENIKRIYRESEKRTAPVRRCPGCGASVRARWSKPQWDLDGSVDPEYSAAWRCFSQGCSQEEF
ncbi:phage terminase large subunit family protein [Streptomyces drozdowiczii]